jgi:hypothetical protein
MTLAVTPDQRSAPKGASSVSRVTAIAWGSSPTGATPGSEWWRCLNVLKRLDGVSQVVVGGGPNAQATLSSLVDEALADGADQLLVAVAPFDNRAVADHPRPALAGGRSALGDGLFPVQ